MAAARARILPGTAPVARQPGRLRPGTGAHRIFALIVDGDLLDGSNDLEFHRRVLKALGQAALDEGAEWLLMHRERPLEHGKL